MARGVAVVPWFDRDPHLTPSSTATASPAEATLYLVGATADPPRCGPLEDWIRLPSDRIEVIARTDRLLARLQEIERRRVHVDADDLLHLGGERHSLSVLEARLLRALLAAPGEVVSREEASEVLWPDGRPSDPRALDNRVKDLRRRLDGLPVEIHTVRGRGFLAVCPEPQL